MSDQNSNSGPYNILFILTDQERYFAPGELPTGYSLPGHERLTKSGVVFENHQIGSCVCTPSRAVIYTGQHIQNNGMFDNTNFPWSGSMSTEIPTLGDMLREADYYTAYKGKWHLTKEFETVNKLGTPTKIFTEEMEAYGFSDYLGVGDIIAHTQGGYYHDGIITAMTQSWLRSKGQPMQEQGKPWFLAVNLINPHDIMFYDTDLPGQKVQGAHPMLHIMREPLDSLYSEQWEFSLPSRHQSLTAEGRPGAHADYLLSHDAMLGHIDDEDARWRRFINYYLNCLRDSDRNVTSILDELDALGLADNTIVVYTADHGELGGAHQLHGKGATAYREQNNVPLIIAHPGVAGGQRCKAVTSHVDLAPTLVGMTNATDQKKAAITKDLPGRNLAPLLAAPAQADYDTVRDSALFNYNMFAYLDGDFFTSVAKFFSEGGKPDGIKQAGLRPNMMKRGAIRSVFDGRYKLSRYFSPKQHNRPATIEALFKLNDVELYDLENDPDEMNNLAIDGKENGELMSAMNAKLNQLIDEEVGEDLGQMLPGGVDAGWAVTPESLDP